MPSDDAAFPGRQPSTLSRLPLTPELSHVLSAIGLNELLALTIQQQPWQEFLAQVALAFLKPGLDSLGAWCLPLPLLPIAIHPALLQEA